MPLGNSLIQRDLHMRNGAKEVTHPTLHFYGKTETPSLPLPFPLRNSLETQALCFVN